MLLWQPGYAPMPYALVLPRFPVSGCRKFQGWYPTCWKIVPTSILLVLSWNAGTHGLRNEMRKVEKVACHAAYCGSA